LEISKNTQFVYNSVDFLGTIYALTSNTLNFTDSNFSYNSALMNGGIFYLSTGAVLFISNCTFFSNYGNFIKLYFKNKIEGYI